MNSFIRTIVLCGIVFGLSQENSNAQKIWENRAGCIRAQANLAPGFMRGQPRANAYIASDLDVFLGEKVAFACGAFYSFSTIRKNQPGVSMNHSIFWGANYHWAKAGRFDPYFGLEPGLGIVQASYESGDGLKKTPVAYVPLISASLGCNYYVGSIFHFFAKVQGVSGHVSSTMPEPLHLDELRCMVGLGWNLRAWKVKV